MRFWVVDSETTGLDKETDKVVEVAGVLLDNQDIVKTYQSLVNPGRSIPPEASAIHHITDEMVVDAPTLDAAMQNILEEEVDFVIAHNAKFDRQFLDLGDYRWLCTWKLANVTWRDAPSFGNQVLRYWLKLPGPQSNTHAHRALYDAETTTQIFLEILKQARTNDPFPKMLEITEAPVLLRTCNFGEHAGKPWAEVPVSYLKWMKSKESSWDEDRAYTMNFWLQHHGVIK
jgi:exodeoxyribonuclease X